MQSSRETKLLNCLSVGLVLLAGFLRLWLRHDLRCSCNSLIFVLFTAAALIWIYQLQKRILQPEVRGNLIAATVLIIVFMMLRTVKYEFLNRERTVARYVWYLYYLPQTFCALLMFLSVLHINRPVDQPINPRWKLLYIPATLIVLGILTNDLHQQAFFFPGGPAAWEEGGYIHGLVYYAAMLWLLVLLIAVLSIVIARCAVPGNRRKLWKPMLPVGIGIFCLVWFLIARDTGVLAMFKTPEVICFVYAAFMEGLVLAHMIPSNDSYGDLWNAASIGAGIMDREDVIRYRSASSIPVTPAQIRQAQDGPVLLRDGSVALRSHDIPGGFGYWTRDISELNRLNRELEELGDVLAEENAMLDAENKLAENRTHIEQQNLLYDSIARSVGPQLARLGSLLDTLPEEEAAFEQAMKFACILNVYIKRRSNLLLLSQQNRQISSGELWLAVSESLEYVSLYGANVHGGCFGQGMLPGGGVLAAYTVFEAVLEAGIPGADAVLVDISVSDTGLSLRMELNSPREQPAAEELRERLAPLRGELEVELEQQTEYVCLTLPLGGEAG